VTTDVGGYLKINIYGTFEGIPEYNLRVGPEVGPYIICSNYSNLPPLTGFLEGKSF